MKISEHEGVPYAALESLACGSSVVAANNPGQPLADGVAPASRVVPGKPETVAGAVAELLGQSAATRVSAVERSREWMGANLTATDVAGQMLQLFASGLARRS